MHNWGTNTMTKAKSKTPEADTPKGRQQFFTAQANRRLKAEADARTKALAKAKAKAKALIEANRKPAYAKANKYMPVGFGDELREVLQLITITEVVEMAEIMGVASQELRTPAGIAMDIKDIECYEGGVKNAVDSMKYWFHAGPAIADGKGSTYVLLQGSVLSWLIDSIMFQITYHGLDILSELGIPL